MILTNFFSALRAGKELANAKTWKNAQLRVSLLVVIISTVLGVATLFGYKLELTIEEITQIAIAIGVVGGLLNGGTTVATTTKLGVQDKSSNRPNDSENSDLDIINAPKSEPKPDIFHDRSVG